MEVNNMTELEKACRELLRKNVSLVEDFCECAIYAPAKDIENIKLAQENTRKNLQTQYLNATNDLMNNQRNFKKQKDNYLLAEDVYTVTMDRYREGIASMTEVLQDEMQMSEAQNNYISAHYNYRVTTLLLLKLTGQIDTLIK